MVDIVLPRAIGQSASVEVGTTTTLPPGSPASVVNVGTSQNAVLNFSIPAGSSSGSGDVVGPASATSGALAVYSGTTGKLIANGPSLGVGASGSVPTRADADARYQAIDAGLTSLAGLSTVGLYYLSAADVWSPVTIGTNLTFTAGTLSATGGGGGSGDVVGPASSVVDQFAVFSNTTGKLLKAVTPTKALVGLGNVDNTSDANKPVSTAQQAALDLRANKTDSVRVITGTTGTILSTDLNGVIETTNAAAVALTVPVLTADFNCLVRQAGAGQVTFTASGTTLRNRQSHTKLAGQWAEASISYRTTTEVVISGDTAA